MDNTDTQAIKDELEKYGWNLDNFNYANPSRSHMFYIRDFRFDNVQVIAHDICDFDIIKTIPGITVKDCIGVIGNAMYKLSHKKPFMDDERKNFLAALIKYTIESQNYKLWHYQSPPDEQLHFSINIYKSSSPKLFPRMITLRPFIFPCDDLMHTPEEVISYSNAIYQHDQEHHPDWFK